MTANPIGAIDQRCTVDEFVAEPLVISFPMVMRDELRNRPSIMGRVERGNVLKVIAIEGTWVKVAVPGSGGVTIDFQLFAVQTAAVSLLVAITFMSRRKFMTTMPPRSTP